MNGVLQGRLEDDQMKAIWHGQVIAESDRTLEIDGYRYFPRESVRMDLLHVTPKTQSDLACPHGVQFYDLAADTDDEGRSLDRLLERRRDQVNARLRASPKKCAGRVNSVSTSAFERHVLRAGPHDFGETRVATLALFTFTVLPG